MKAHSPVRAWSVRLHALHASTRSQAWLRLLLVASVLASFLWMFLLAATLRWAILEIRCGDAVGRASAARPRLPWGCRTAATMLGRMLRSGGRQARRGLGADSPSPPAASAELAAPAGYAGPLTAAATGAAAAAAPAVGAAAAASTTGEAGGPSAQQQTAGAGQPHMAVGAVGVQLPAAGYAGPGQELHGVRRSALYESVLVSKRLVVYAKVRASIQSPTSSCICTQRARSFLDAGYPNCACAHPAAFTACVCSGRCSSDKSVAQGTSWCKLANALMRLWRKLNGCLLYTVCDCCTCICVCIALAWVALLGSV